MIPTPCPSTTRRFPLALHASGTFCALSLIAFSYLSSNRATAAVSGYPDAPETAAAGAVTGAASGAVPVDSVVTDSLDNVTELDDFVITSQRKLVSSDGATLTYQVSDDPEAGSSNILDILRKVPGVTVDAQDNVRVNGKTNFKILVNNREDPMLSADKKTALKSMPAASIKKIEVISEPGAKYDAEGAGGILNFITETKTNMSGVAGTLQTWINNYNAGGSLNARGKVGKVMIGTDFQYNNSRIWQRAKQYGLQEIEDLNTGSLTRARSASATDFRFIYPKLNLSWEPDSLNLFTLTTGWRTNPWNTRTSNSRESIDADGETLWRIGRQISDRNVQSGTSTQASYQHSFHRPDHLLVLSYLFEWQKSKQSTRYFTDEALNLTEPPFTLSDRYGYRQAHVVQADYSNRFNSRHLLEAGFKANLENIPLDTRQYAGTDEADAIPLPDATVAFSQFKDIYALYSSYTGSYGKWGVKAGLRWEYTRIGLKYRIGNYDSFSSRLNDWVPNAAVNYNISDAQTIRAAYQMRIWRPGVYWLNPYVDDMTPGRLQYGNPDLESEHTHNVSLGYTNYEGDFTGGAKITWRYATNGVTDVIFMEGNVLHSTYANVGHENSLTIEGNFDWKVSDRFNWGFSASATYEDYRAHTELVRQRNHAWQTYLNTNVAYTMPCKVRMSAYGGFYTPWIDLQSRSNRNGYYYGLGFSRAFLKNDALNVNLSAGTCLPVSNFTSYTQKGEGVVYRGRTEYKQWYVGLGVSFRFGALKSDVKRTAAIVETDNAGGGNSKK